MLVFQIVSSRLKLSWVTLFDTRRTPLNIFSCRQLCNVLKNHGHHYKYNCFVSKIQVAGQQVQPGCISMISYFSHTPSLCLLFWKTLQIFHKSMLCSKLQVAGQAGWVGLHLWNSWQRCVGRRDKHFFLSFQSFNLSTLLPHFIAPCLYFTRKVIPFFRPNFRNSWRQRCVGRGEGGQAADYFDYRPSTRPPAVLAGTKWKCFQNRDKKPLLATKWVFANFWAKGCR